MIGGTDYTAAADFDLLLTGGEDDVDQADFPNSSKIRRGSSPRPAAREFLAMILPTRRSMTSFFHSRFSQLARTFSNASSMRRSKRSCIAFSFSPRSRLRHKMYVSLPPSGTGLYFQTFADYPPVFVKQLTLELSH